MISLAPIIICGAENTTPYIVNNCLHGGWSVLIIGLGPLAVTHLWRRGKID